MGWVRLTPPLLFQSKLLCLSLLYLLTTVPFSLYVSFSKRGCLFNFPQPLFHYPSTYGEHSHAIPASRSSCASPILFPDYGAAFDEIRSLCRNSSSPVLKYMQGNRRTFAGNFSATYRRSFFNLADDPRPIPCGFLREFIIKDSDRAAMERCHGVVIISAIFGDHDKIRQPKGLGFRTHEFVCFFMFVDDSTIRGLNSHRIIIPGSGSNAVGVWRIIRLFSGKLPYDNPAMNGVIPKYLPHRLFPNSKFSLWIDAKLQLTVDPLLLVHSLLVSVNADMAVSKHPFNIHTMEEAIATARWKKWLDVESLRIQMETYCENGLQPWSQSKLPHTTDVPDTAMIARRHGTASDLFSCLVFNELEAFNPRDQLAFAYVRDLMSPRIRINMFENEVLEQVAIEYRHNLKREAGAPAAKLAGRAAAAADIGGSKCEDYLRRMWGETTDDSDGS